MFDFTSVVSVSVVPDFRLKIDDLASEADGHWSKWDGATSVICLNLQLIFEETPYWLNRTFQLLRLIHEELALMPAPVLTQIVVKRGEVYGPWRERLQHLHLQAELHSELHSPQIICVHRPQNLEEEPTTVFTRSAHPNLRIIG
jgi:hypothetical protein